MKKRYLSFGIVALLTVVLFAFKNDQDPMVLIQTEFGDIKIKLYNETPQHRDNFLKLAEQGFYNDLLFHRVIKGFMIQGGDPKSKDAAPDIQLGGGGPGYTVPAEFSTKLVHKKGALCAARQGDNVNPEKRSSGSQFYIVQGRTYKAEDLKNIEVRYNNNTQRRLTKEFFLKPENEAYKKRYSVAVQNRNNQDVQAIMTEIKPIVDAEMKEVGAFSYSEEQVKTYETIGGTPQLDFEYTVFGEVVEGLDVIDKIAEGENGAADRPLKDVKMTMEIIK